MENFITLCIPTRYFFGYREYGVEQHIDRHTRNDLKEGVELEKGTAWGKGVGVVWSQLFPMKFKEIARRE